MRFLKNLTLMLTALFCLLVSVVNAKILWEKELALDVNINSYPVASCLNKDANGIIVMSVECPQGSLPIKGNNVMWEIWSNGNAIRTVLTNAEGNKVQTNNAIAAGVGSGCAIASDSLGNLLTVGILNKQKDEKGQKVALVSKSNKTEKTMLSSNLIETHSIKNMIPLQDNTFFIVGDQNSNGLCMQVDSQGKILQEKLFNVGQTDIFSSVDSVKPDNSNLVIAGVSTEIFTQKSVKNSAQNFVILCDSHCDVIKEDYFAGAVPGLVLPKVHSLNNGNIIAVYKKESTDPNKTLLSMRCYTKELELLLERELITADKSLSVFGVAPHKSGFVVGIVKLTSSLEFYFFDDNGIQTDYTEYKGMVGIVGFNLINVQGKTIVVFDRGTAGNIKECSIKANVIALD